MLKKALQQKKTTVGSWITLGNLAVAEIMAKAGFDWLVVDLEHSVISIDIAGDLIRTIDLCGVTPLVRLTSNNSDQIKRMMDAGAHGIVVPSVNSADDAKNAVAATRYGPEGFRGVGLARAQGYGVNFQQYLKWQHNGPIVIVMIEHQIAIKNLNEILSVPGVDGFIIGPYDLSCSMGIPGEFNNPIFIDAIKHIREVGEFVGCPTGLHIVEPDINELERVINEGYCFIAYGVDMRMLDVSARLGIKKRDEICK